MALELGSEHMARTPGKSGRVPACHHLSRDQWTIGEGTIEVLGGRAHPQRCVALARDTTSMLDLTCCIPECVMALGKE